MSVIEAIDWNDAHNNHKNHNNHKDAKKLSAGALLAIQHMEAHLQEFARMIEAEIKNVEHYVNKTVNMLVPVGEEDTVDPDLKASLLALLQDVKHCHGQLKIVKKKIL